MTLRVLIVDDEPVARRGILRLLQQEPEAWFARGASGDDDARVPIRSQDEIGRLGQYFNRMLERLQVRTRELADTLTGLTGNVG